MKKKPQHISGSISELLAAIHKSYPDEAHRIWEIWRDVVGPELGKRTAPIDYRSGKLTVGVEGSSWLSQMQFLAPEIMSSLNRRLAGDVVKSIRFKPAVIEKPDEPEPEGTVLREGPLDECEQNLLNTETSHIEDPELAEAVRNAMEAALRRSVPRRNPKD